MFAANLLVPKSFLLAAVCTGRPPHSKKPPTDTGFPAGALSGNPSASAGDAGDLGLLCGLEWCSGGNSNPLQYSCLENSMDRGACRGTVHRVTKSQTWPSIAQPNSQQERCYFYYAAFYLCEWTTVITLKVTAFRKGYPVYLRL